MSWQPASPTSVHDFVKTAFKLLDFDLEWSGEGVNEKAIDKSTGKVVVAVDPKIFRPADVNSLCGDSTKARTILGWKLRYSLEYLIREMVTEDLKLVC